MSRTSPAVLTYRAIGVALGLLPESVALGAARLGGDALFHLQRGPRTTVQGNLRRVLDAEGSDEFALWQWSRRSFEAYARYWVEGARLGTMSPAEIRARTVTEGLEHLWEGIERGKGVILALPHVGSWEFGGAFMAANGVKLTAVAERLEPPELFDYFVEQRAAMGIDVIPLGPKAGAEISKTLRAGKVVCLLCDRDLEGNGIEVDFFGERTTMPAGPATLALRTGATLLTAAVYSGPGRSHLALVEPPIDTTRSGPLRQDVARLTQEIATRLEGLIRRAPEQWHVFQPLWLEDRPGQA